MQTPWIFTAVVLLAACADDAGAPLRARDRRPGASSSGSSSGSTSSGSPGSSSGSSTSSSGSSGLSASSGGSSGISPEPGLCAVSEQFGISQPVLGLEAVNAATEFAISPDERVLAWIDAAPGVHVASRSSESAAFGAPVTALPAAPFATPRGLALSEDALHLTLLNDARTQLGELTRVDRDSAFDVVVDTSVYSAIEPDATSGALLGVALGAQSRLLVVTRARPASPQFSVLLAERSEGGEWPLPSPRTEQALSGAIQTVTGISHDGLTFFVRAANGLRAINRPNLGGTFEPEYERPLGGAHAAIPNAACDRLYVLEAGALRVRPQVLE